MIENAFLIKLDSDSGVYQAGEMLSGTYQMTIEGPVDLQTLEVSIYWHTEGKGDEDLGVSFFHQEARDGAEGVVPQPDGVFTTRLPTNPLSYDGVLIKVLWSVRVRGVLIDGRQAVAVREFRLGEVDPGREVEAS